MLTRPHDGADIARRRGAGRDALAAQFPGVGFDITRKSADEVRRILYNDIDGDQKLYNVLAILTLLGAAFAAFNLAGRMVEAQRREIGIGMALGVTPGRLASPSRCSSAPRSRLSVQCSGWVVGLVVGRLMAGVLQSYFPLPVWQFPFQIGIYLRGAALGLLLPFVAVAWPVWRAVRVTPLEAIRTGALAPARVSAFARVPLPGTSLDQMPFRNVLRTPRRTVLTALGIAAAITVLVGVVGMLDSFTETIDRTDSELLRQSADRVVVDLDGFVPTTSSTVAAIDGASTVGSTETNLSVGGRLEHGGTTIDTMLTMLDLDSGIWAPTLHDRAPAGKLPGVVLSEKAAQDLGVKPGDRIVLRHPRVTGPTSFEYVRSPVRVIATSALPTRFTTFMSIDDAAIMGLTGITNSLVVTPAPGATGEQVRRQLFGEPGVASVQSVSAFTDSVSDALKRVESILYIVEGIVLLLALLIAFNSASINSDERARDHATMFAFGLPVRRVLGMAVTESVVIGIIGTLIGVAGGFVLLGWLINSLFATTFPDLGIVTVLAPRTVVIAVGLGVVAVAFAPLLGARRVRNMDIPSTLRVVE